MKKFDCRKYPLLGVRVKPEAYDAYNKLLQRVRIKVNSKLDLLVLLCW